MKVIQFRPRTEKKPRLLKVHGGSGSTAVSMAMAFLGATLLYTGVLTVSQDAATGSIIGAIGVLLCVKPVMSIMREVRTYLGPLRGFQTGVRPGAWNRHRPKRRPEDENRTYH